MRSTCSWCGYDLRGLGPLRFRCPECGVWFVGPDWVLRDKLLTRDMLRSAAIALVLPLGLALPAAPMGRTACFWLMVVALVGIPLGTVSGTAYGFFACVIRTRHQAAIYGPWMTLFCCGLVSFSASAVVSGVLGFAGLLLSV